ncbi:MAG: hypothetical protein MI864_12440 [Pseudomonadales bacterium]|nr:hypothetical protein [Pseudomonadales bacterium]
MITKLKNMIAELGWVATLLYTIDRVLHRVSERMGCYFYYFYQQPLTERKLPVPTRKVYDFYWLSALNEQIQLLPRPLPVLENRFAQGATCIVAQKEEDQSFLGCAWFAFNVYQEDEVYCIYDFQQCTGAVWDYDVYITPEQRMTRLFLRLWQNAERELVDQGFSSSLSRISAYNAQSVNSHEKFGAKRIGWAVFFKFFKLQVTITSKAPYIGVCFGFHNQPVIRFH